MGKVTRIGICFWLCVGFSLNLGGTSIAGSADIFAASSGPLKDLNTGEIQKAKEKNGVEITLPGNAANLPSKNEWSIKKTQCVQYLRQDIKKFNDYLRGKDAKKPDLRKAHETLERSLYPYELHASQGWAEDGWIYVGDCRRHALEAERAMRAFLKKWKGPSGEEEKEERSPGSVSEPEEKLDEKDEKGGEETQKLEEKIKELEDLLRERKEEYRQLKESICQAFSSEIMQEPEGEEEKAEEEETPEDVVKEEESEEEGEKKEGTSEKADEALEKKAFGRRERRQVALKPVLKLAVAKRPHRRSRSSVGVKLTAEKSSAASKTSTRRTRSSVRSRVSSPLVSKEGPGVDAGSSEWRTSSRVRSRRGPVEIPVDMGPAPKRRERNGDRSSFMERLKASSSGGKGESDEDDFLMQASGGSVE